MTKLILSQKKSQKNQIQQKQSRAALALDIARQIQTQPEPEIEIPWFLSNDWPESDGICRRCQMPASRCVCGKGGR